MEQEEKNHKSMSTGKVKNGTDTNTTINRNVVTYNVDITRGKSLSLN